jgi:hypothetical protein
MTSLVGMSRAIEMAMNSLMPRRQFKVDAFPDAK